MSSSSAIELHEPATVMIMECTKLVTMLFIAGIFSCSVAGARVEQSRPVSVEERAISFAPGEENYLEEPLHGECSYSH